MKYWIYIFLLFSTVSRGMQPIAHDGDLKTNNSPTLVIVPIDEDGIGDLVSALSFIPSIRLTNLDMRIYLFGGHLKNRFGGSKANKKQIAENLIEDFGFSRQRTVITEGQDDQHFAKWIQKIAKRIKKDTDVIIVPSLFWVNQALDPLKKNKRVRLFSFADVSPCPGTVKYDDDSLSFNFNRHQDANRTISPGIAMLLWDPEATPKLPSGLKDVVGNEHARVSLIMPAGNRAEEALKSMQPRPTKYVFDGQSPYNPNGSLNTVRAALLDLRARLNNDADATLFLWLPNADDKYLEQVKSIAVELGVSNQINFVLDSVTVAQQTQFYKDFWQQGTFGFEKGAIGFVRSLYAFCLVVQELAVKRGINDPAALSEEVAQSWPVVGTFFYPHHGSLFKYLCCMTNIDLYEMFSLEPEDSRYQKIWRAFLQKSFPIFEKEQNLRRGFAERYRVINQNLESISKEGCPGYKLTMILRDGQPANSWCFESPFFENRKAMKFKFGESQDRRTLADNAYADFIKNNPLEENEGASEMNEYSLMNALVDMMSLLQMSESIQPKQKPVKSETEVVRNLHSCAYCQNNANNMKRCAKCKVAYYCSRDCQLKDWGNHKANCLASEK